MGGRSGNCVCAFAMIGSNDEKLIAGAMVSVEPAVMQREPSTNHRQDRPAAST